MSNAEKYKNNPLYSDITRLDHLSPQPTFTYSWNIETSTWEPSTTSTTSGTVGESSVITTKTVCQKIEEDFILLENIPDSLRYGESSGKCYGENFSVMNDIFNTHFNNGRTEAGYEETGHPDYFIHEESINTGRCVELNETFHSDTLFSLRSENGNCSDINSYELKDFSNIYKSGQVDNIIIFNESPYPIQFHTANETINNNIEYGDILYLYPDTAVQISSLEASKIFVKRPHTISGFEVKYAINYKK